MTLHFPDPYVLRTVIDGEIVSVRCAEYAARVLLPLWARDHPNDTSCLDLRDLTWVTAFEPEQENDYDE